MIQTANVDHRGNEVIVSSYSQTEAGFYIMNGVFTRLGEPLDDHELGSAIDDALSSSRDGIPVPDPESPLPATPILEALGLDSYAAYMAGARAAQVERDGEIVRVVPTRNGGAREGFVEIREKERELRNPSVTELGAEVRKALAEAR